MKQVLIIGGGAAGMTAAITAAESGAEVLVLERCRKSLRKLAVSGNGRGNLLNRGERRYYGDAAYADAVLEAAGDGAEGFWRRIGVPLTEETEGRVYPSSFSAAAAADAMRLRAA